MDNQFSQPPHVNIKIDTPTTANIHVSTKSSKKNSNTLNSVFKSIAQSILILGVLAFGWLYIDMHSENPYLSKIGIKNTKKNYLEKEKIINTLETQVTTLTRDVNKLQKKITNKEFSEFSKEIENIKQTQLNWFDKKENGTLIIGLFDATEKVRQFFRSGAFKDEKKIITNGNIITIEEQSITREGADLTISASQQNRRLFYLVNELVKQMNAYPFFKDGSISEFNKDVDEATGNESMKFSISLNRQNENEVDPADKQFEAFNKWASKK